MCIHEQSTAVTMTITVIVTATVTLTLIDACLCITASYAAEAACELILGPCVTCLRSCDMATHRRRIV